MAERFPSKRWALRRRAFTLLLRTVQPFETSMEFCAQKALPTYGRGVQFQIGAVLPPATLRVATRAGQYSITPRGRIRRRGQRLD